MKEWILSCTAGMLLIGAADALHAQQHGPRAPRTVFPADAAYEAAPHETSNGRLPQQAIAPVGFLGHGDGCAEDVCEVPCDDVCGVPFGRHRSGVFGDYLFLSARDVDLSIAQPQDGFGATAVPTGRTVMADNDYESGFRVGGRIADDCGRSSLEATYWYFDSSSQVNQVLPGATEFLRATTVHPNTTNVAADSLFASADYDVDFQIVDVVFRRALLDVDCYTDTALDAVFGVRYGHLEQNLLANYGILGNTQVHSDIDIDGIGPRIGLEGEQLWDYGVFFYGRGHASFLVGEFSADYRQTNVFAGQQAQAGFDDDRILPIYELELGAGWQSRCGRFRLMAGYYLAWWTNTLTTPTFVQAVQNGNLVEVDETLGFDGLTTRAEIRF